MPKFAPPDASGRKPWVREVYEWGRTSSSVLYAEEKGYARRAFRESYHATVTVRRATVEDLERLRVTQDWEFMPVFGPPAPPERAQDPA